MTTQSHELFEDCPTPAYGKSKGLNAPGSGRYGVLSPGRRAAMGHYKEAKAAAEAEGSRSVRRGRERG